MMKRLFPLLFLLLSFSGFTQSNWIKGHAVWNYEWFHPSSNGMMRIETMNDTLVQGHLCQKLKCDKHEINTVNQNGDIAHYITTTYSYIYFEQDTVWYLKGQDFYILYDFTAVQGQMRQLEPGFENSECNDSSYLFVDSVYSEDLNGETAMFYQTRDSSTNSILHGGLYNSHFGMMSGDFGFSHYLFPAFGWCNTSPNDGTMYKLRCFQDDSLVYNPGNVDCEYYTYLSLNELDEVKVSLFPNPATDKVLLRSEEVVAEVTLYNMIGKECIHKPINLAWSELDSTGLNAGTYQVKIKTVSGKIVLKRIQVKK